MLLYLQLDLFFPSFPLLSVDEIHCGQIKRDQLKRHNGQNRKINTSFFLFLSLFSLDTFLCLALPLYEPGSSRFGSTRHYNRKVNHTEADCKFIPPDALESTFNPHSLADHLTSEQETPNFKLMWKVCGRLIGFDRLVHNTLWRLNLITLILQEPKVAN